MEVIVGIDLGTTNSAISLVRETSPEVFRNERGLATLPSVVGFGANGQLLVGESARNQALIAPERTVKSIKRKMGEEIKVSVAGKEYSPQEISAIILRTLRELAESALGHAVVKAVITVPAYFNENQREATRLAGELAGLNVVRIINEPTAAILVYEPHSERNERILVYDLGGGTFDVSIVQIERGVIEVLSSHGDTHLGGDDFDELLLNYVCDEFSEEHGIDLRKIPVAQSRLLQAVEEAKKRLSTEVVAEISEEFIAEKDGQPLHLRTEITRGEYEDLIAPLIERSIACIDAAMSDAKLLPTQLDRVILVGGSSRTPMVQNLLRNRLEKEPHLEIDPDLCVAMGAAVQGALIAGRNVGTLLVDITPHTLGIESLVKFSMARTELQTVPIIHRNSPLPASRSEMFRTATPGQAAVQIRILQGEYTEPERNESIGEFLLEGLDTDLDEESEVIVRFDLTLDGQLKVSAIDRTTGRENFITVNSAMARFRTAEGARASTALAEAFGDSAKDAPSSAGSAEPSEKAASAADSGLSSETTQLIAKARRLLPSASKEDEAEIRELIDVIQGCAAQGNQSGLDVASGKLIDLLFYVEDR
ncbi:MAG: Hsp70 family protein [Planctomyces sp.]|nr:Hsp70 family protein [Planctomyces sp.]